jgi:hypothetical protein
MGSPAGFLNFQGHNALDGGYQYISMNFSNIINDSLAFDDSLNDFPYDSLESCDYKTSESMIHNFTVFICLFSLHKIALVPVVRQPVIPKMDLFINNQMSYRA